MIRPGVLVLTTDDVGYSTYDWPRIHDALASGYQSASFSCAIVKAAYHLACNNLSCVLWHLKTYAKDHEHVVNSVDAHRVYVTQGVAARNAALDIGVVY